MFAFTSKAKLRLNKHHKVRFLTNKHQEIVALKRIAQHTSTKKGIFKQQLVNQQHGSSPTKIGGFHQGF